MGIDSIIEWTHSTYNPWRGCKKVSPGCSECYMFRDQRRYGRDPDVIVRAADSTFYAPQRSKKWRKRAAEKAAAGEPHLVFTCSWSDFFIEEADEWRPEVWDLIRDTPEHTYQVLTKRPERMAECLPADWGEGYANVWLGVTIENHRFVDRADILRATPAAIRFISAEPLLGPLIPPEQPCTVCGNLGYVVEGRDHLDGDGEYLGTEAVQVQCPNTQWHRYFADPATDGPGINLANIDWLIAGGESGGRVGRRLVDENKEPKEEALRWIGDLRDEAAREGTAFHFKQWGGPRPDSGGRELDGRTWDEIPAGASR